MSNENKDFVKLKEMSCYILKNKPRIETALPKHLTSNRMINSAMAEIRKNKLITECDPVSVLNSIITCSQLGLTIGPSLGHAYLIPYKSECQLIIGYRGMLDLARRSGILASINAHVVYENDYFEFQFGLNHQLTHRPAEQDKGRFRCAYAIAHLKDGGYQFDVMFKSEIDEIRNGSPGKNHSPWVKYYDEMAKKTVIRRLFKYLPISVEMQRAVVLDEYADAGAQREVIDIELADYEEVQQENKPTKTEQIADKLQQK